MSETVTLTLTSQVAERAHETATRTGKSLETVLAEWLEQAAAKANSLQSDVQYEVWSPFNSTATALALQEFIDQQRKQDKQDT